ncbi:PilZ domain-containing protein [bacterium]|nr:MAG: PilZ domain-containing protein [bacterium]
MADKRKNKRKIKRFQVKFLCGTEEYRGISSNLSHTGLYIRTRKTFKSGIPVKIVMEVDEDKKIVLRGVIVRQVNRRYGSSDNGIGIEFDETPQEYKDLVEFILKKGW